MSTVFIPLSKIAGPSGGFARTRSSNRNRNNNPSPPQAGD